MPVVSLGFGHRDLVTAGTRLSGSHWCLAIWFGLAGGQQLHKPTEEMRTVTLGITFIVSFFIVQFIEMNML